MVSAGAELAAANNNPATVIEISLLFIESLLLFLQGQALYAHNLREDNVNARNLFLRALALDAGFMRAHAAFALAHADSHALLAVSLLYADDTRASVRHIERAMQLSPIQSARYRSVLGFSHYFAGRHDQARAALEGALEQNPARLLPQLYLAATLGQLDKLDEANWLADTIRTEHPEFKLQHWADTQPFANQAQLRKVVNDLQRIGLN